MVREIRTVGAWLTSFALAGCATASPSTKSEVAQTDGFRKCAETFEAVYVEHRDHDKADTLLWNAADCHRAARDRTGALLAYDLLLSRFPDSPHADGARAAVRQLEQCKINDAKSCEFDSELEGRDE